MRQELTQQRLHSLIRYDPQTGLMYWRETRRGVVAGLAGHRDGRGYLSIVIDRQRHYVHRLAFLYTLGYLPTEQVDHVDRDKSNNRWSNLREATCTQNRTNTGLKSSNTSGYIGVTWSKQHRRWQARIRAGGRRIYLGSFRTAEAASAARERAAKEFHKEFAA